MSAISSGTRDEENILVIHIKKINLKFDKIDPNITVYLQYWWNIAAVSPVLGTGKLTFTSVVY